MVEAVGSVLNEITIFSSINNGSYGPYANLQQFLQRILQQFLHSQKVLQDGVGEDEFMNLGGKTAQPHCVS